MTTYTVTTIADEDAGTTDLATETADGAGLSLREALAIANANADTDTITFDSGLSGQTITLGGTHLTIDESVTIDGDLNGDGAPDLTIDANGTSRVLEITGGTVTLDGLTMTGGDVTGVSENGGGILTSAGSNVTIQNSIVENNQGRLGGGVDAVGDLTIINSHIANNSATFSAGGIRAAENLTITDSSIVGNSGQFFYGAIEAFGATVTITNSTIAQNIVISSNTDTGGVYTSFSDVTITDSTFTGNNGLQLNVYAVDANVTDSVFTGDSSTTLNITSSGGTTTNFTFSGTNVISGSVNSPASNVFGAPDVQSDLSQIFAATETVSGQNSGALTSNGNGQYAATTGTYSGIGAQSLNSAPTISGAPLDVSVLEDAETALGLGDVEFADTDGDTLTVTLTIDSGTFTTLADGDALSVTETLVGATEITLVGAAANINSYLDTSTNIGYTGAADNAGDNAATLTIDVSDGTASAGSETVNIDITGVNDDPTISGTPGTLNFFEDTAGDVDLSSVTISDVDSSSATVTLSVDSGTFAAPADGSSVGSGVTATLDTPTTITLVGTIADINSYLGTASNISWTASANANGSNLATLSISVNDGNGSGDVSLGSVDLDVTAVNDAPVIVGVEGETSSLEIDNGFQNVPLLDDVTVSDDDSTDFDGGTLTILQHSGSGWGNWGVDGTTVTSGGDATISVGESVSVGGTLIGTVTADGQASTALTISLNSDATPNLIEVLLSNLLLDAQSPSFAPPQSADYRITLTDNDGTANGGAESVSVEFDIDIVSQPASATGLPTDVDAVEETASDFDLSSLVLSDPDSTDLTITLTASSGTMAATSAGGVTIGGSGTDTLTLSGTIANLNSFFATATNIQYSGTTNVSGDDAATVTVEANDAGGAGDVALGTVNVDIADVNDPAVFGGDLTGTMNEENTTETGTATVTDIDGADSFVAETIEGAAGTLTINAGGDWTYDLDDAASGVQALAHGETYEDTISVQAADGTTQDIVVTIIGINDAPTASNGSVNIQEGGSHDFDASDFGFSDVDSGDSLASVRIDTLTVGSGTLTLSGVAVTAGDVITVADINAGNLVYEPASDDFGTGLLTFTFSVNDGTVFAASPSTMTVNVANVVDNSPPRDVVLSPANVNEEVEGAVIGTLSATDPEGTDVTFALVGDDRFTLDGNVLSLAGGVSFDFETNEQVSLEIKVTDGDGVSSTAIIIVRINDVVEPVVGDDNSNVITGDDAFDNLRGGGGNDTIDGGGGDDFLRGDDGDDRISGGAGNDRSFAGNNDNGNDTVEGNDGNDVLGGGNGNDLIVGGDAGTNVNDSNPGSSDDDTLFGGSGDDLIVAGSYNTQSDTVVNTGGGSNLLWGGGGNDRVFGDDGDDVIGGGLGNDSVQAGGGNDTLYGGRSGDETNNDTLRGGNGDDLILASDDDDIVFGEAGDDTLFGGAGDDTVDGGSGSDILWAGGGDDQLTGGSGADTFVFGNVSGNDTVTDFNSSEDVLDLRFASTDFASVAEVQAAATATTQGGQTGVLIDLGDGDSVFVVGLGIGGITDATVTV